MFNNSYSKAIYKNWETFHKHANMNVCLTIVNRKLYVIIVKA
jgi:hypothetical protein